MHERGRPGRPARRVAGVIGAMVVVLVTGNHASAQSAARTTLAADRAAAIDALFAEFAGEAVPGAAVLASRGDTILFARGYGIADLEAGDRVTAATSFRLASVSKQFTAIAILTLVDDERLSLSAPLADVLAGTPHYARQVRVDHLLTHTSGLPDYEPLAGGDAGPPLRDGDVLALLQKARGLYFEPGTAWRYSNSGYALLALVVEHVSGRPFAHYLRDRVFHRAGMSSAVAHVEGIDSVPRRAYGHSLVSGAWRRTDQSRTSAVLGDGGVYASVEDLHRWSRALDRYSIVSEALFRQAVTPAVLASGRVTDYGFGWFLDSHRGHRRQRHEGDTIGFRTAFHRYPDDGLTVVVLVNRGHAPVDALADSVATLFLDR